MVRTTVRYRSTVSIDADFFFFVLHSVIIKLHVRSSIFGTRVRINQRTRTTFKKYVLGHGSKKTEGRTVATHSSASDLSLRDLTMTA